MKDRSSSHRIRRKTYRSLPDSRVLCQRRMLSHSWWVDSKIESALKGDERYAETLFTPLESLAACPVRSLASLGVWAIPLESRRLSNGVYPTYEVEEI